MSTGATSTVDVVMPTLRGSPYLAEAIDSVFAQTLTSWRLIVSENGSPTDEVREVLSNYASDERVIHSVVGEDITMAENWTRAIRLAEAPYVAMLHDDDRWDPEFLARRVELMDANPSCGFVFGGYRSIDETGEVIRTVKPDLAEGPIPQARILTILYENCLVTPPTALIRTAAYEAVGAEYKEIFLTDYEMWLRLAARFDVGYLSVCDSDYRLHHGQNTAKNRIRFGEGELEVIAATRHLPVPASVRRRARGKAHLLCAIDNAELGRRRDAFGHLRSAVRSQPSLLLRPASAARIVGTLLALAFGERGRRAFSALRYQRFRKRSTSARVQSPS